MGFLPWTFPEGPDFGMTSIVRLSQCGWCVMFVWLHVLVSRILMILVSISVHNVTFFDASKLGFTQLQRHFVVQLNGKTWKIHVFLLLLVVFYKPNASIIIYKSPLKSTGQTTSPALGAPRQSAVPSPRPPWVCLGSEWELGLCSCALSPFWIVFCWWFFFFLVFFFVFVVFVFVFFLMLFFFWGGGGGGKLCLVIYFKSNVLRLS